jgi:hypothetical protein
MSFDVFSGDVTESTRPEKGSARHKNYTVWGRARRRAELRQLGIPSAAALRVGAQPARTPMVRPGPYCRE